MPEWDYRAGARIVMQRSHGLCEVCRRPGAQTHHRQARGLGGVSRAGTHVNRPSCLLRTCVRCHTWIESRREDAQELGLLVSRPTDPAAVPAWLFTIYGGPSWWLLGDDGGYLAVDGSPPPAAAVMGGW